MDTIRICQQCRKPLPQNAPEGLCPECLARVALGSEPSIPGKRIPPDPADLAAQFPQLEILELLGMGGMGMVYKARQPKLDRFVALKILPIASMPDASFAERFEREAKALARLNHPGIVTLHDFGQTKEYYYFIMEFVDGMNLRQLIRAKTLEPRQALELVTQICTALQFAHDENIVHRDIKPENILITKKGQVKIADFGLAKLLGSQPDTALTASQMVMGTLNYMAPEQRENTKDVDHRADIYSLGVVFYEMLTGEVPMGRFEAPSKKVQIDVRLDEVVLHALEREPARRYQQASEVRSGVEAITSSMPVKANAIGKPWPAWVWWALLILVTLPFFQLAEVNRNEQMAGHSPKYGMGGVASIVLLLLGGFAVIKLLELRQVKGGATPGVPFSQAWLETIVAIFGLCLIAIGPFPHVEWLHETLKVMPAKVADAAGAKVELAGFSQTLVKHGYEFWQGKAIALVSVLAGALMLLAPRSRLRWNMVSSVLLLVAGVMIVILAGNFEFHRPPDAYLTMQAVEEQAKNDAGILQFRDDFKRHKATEAENKNVSAETIEHLSGFYNGAFREYKFAYGYVVCIYAALALILIGVLKLRQTMMSSPAPFANWSLVVETWGSLLLLVPCLLSVLPVFVFSWEGNMAWIPLFKGQTWFGDWVKESRLSRAGVEFWQGRVIAAACIVAVLVVFATALLRWKRGARAAALSLAGFAAIACTVHFFDGLREDATISWQDFQAVARRGAAAAGSLETRRFLAENPRYVEQIVELENNVQTLTAKLTVPEPVTPKVTATKSADGKTTYTTTEVPVPVISDVERNAQARILAQGNGVVSLYTYSKNGAQWSVLFGLGVLLLGIRDGYQSWRKKKG